MVTTIIMVSMWTEIPQDLCSNGIVLYWIKFIGCVIITCTCCNTAGIKICWKWACQAIYNL